MRWRSRAMHSCKWDHDKKSASDFFMEGWKAGFLESIFFHRKLFFLKWHQHPGKTPLWCAACLHHCETTLRALHLLGHGENVMECHGKNENLNGQSHRNGVMVGEITYVNSPTWCDIWVYLKSMICSPIFRRTQIIALSHFPTATIMSEKWNGMEWDGSIKVG